MSNLSEKKRQEMLKFLEDLRENYKDEYSIIAINEIENDINEKKYGLVWEEHIERVDEELKDKVPVFVEQVDKKINTSLEDSYNFLIEGDNLHSLYLLEKTHKNKIDVIYIDPPYNTGNKDFVYDDNYIVKEDNYKHSKWLSFMNKRLRIARKLLKKTGVVFISIDDNEYAQLKMLCDEVFGSENSIGPIIQNKLNAKNDSINIQKNHEYILVYRKQGMARDGKIEPTLAKKNTKVRKINFDGEGYFYINDTITTRGDGGTLEARKNLGYTIYYNPTDNDIKAISDYKIDLVGKTEEEEELYIDNKELIRRGYIPVRPPRVRGKLGAWTWDINKLNDNKKEILIKRGKDKYLVYKKKFVEAELVYENDGELYYDTINNFGNTKSILEYSTNEGTNELNKIIGSGKFNNPKNLRMIEDILELVPDKNCLILDFFAGSGTTGQAVLELNKKDGGNRKFILCTNNENNICENITYKRIKNVINGYDYKGKRENVLYEKKLTQADLKKYNSILENVAKIKEENTKFDKIKTVFKDGIYKVVGVKEYDGKTDAIKENLKYYKTDYIDKFGEEDTLMGEKMLNHIKEMVELENGIDTDTKKHYLALVDGDVEALINDKKALEKCKIIYLAADILLTSREAQILKTQGIKISIVPEYYFENELREVGEI